jgi:thymidylate synthase
MREFPSADTAIVQILQEADAGEWVERPSEKGATIEFPGVYVAKNTNPYGYVSQCGIRNANPFFHMAEALWMLSGREDLEFLLLFNSTFGNYSDDGKIIRGSAYGKRWRSWFGKDQIEVAAHLLATRPTTRQVVLSQWSVDDLGIVSKDIPCNLQTLFLVRDNRLDMTVTNRSNDLLWGMYGSNIVHFSILHHYMAAKAGLLIGDYYQVSNCLHVYDDNPILARYRESIFKNKFEDVWRDAPIIASSLEEALEVSIDISKFFTEFDTGGEPMDRLARAANHVYNTKFMEIFASLVRMWITYKDKTSENSFIFEPEDAFSLSANNFVRRRGKAL